MDSQLLIFVYTDIDQALLKKKDIQQMFLKKKNETDLLMSNIKYTQIKLTMSVSDINNLL